MKQNSVYLFVALICFSVSSCEKDPIGNVISLHDDLAVPVSEWSRYDVTTHDAERYVKLHNPEKTYEMTSYVEGADTLLYVYNFSDGWVVLSGDRRVGPVIAESPTGRLDMNDEQGYVFWIRSNAENILALKEDGPEIENKSVRMWDMIAPVSMNKVPQTKAAYKKWVIREFPINQKTTWETEVPHLIQTKWGQKEPWNMTAPKDMTTLKKLPLMPETVDRCTIGCVAVAVSQLLYYLHYYIGKPNALYHDVSWADSIFTSTSDIGFFRSGLVTDSNRWDDMLKDPYIDNREAMQYVTDFMMDVGNRYGMKYSAETSNAGGSGCSMSPTAQILSEIYDISCKKADYNVSIIQQQLYNGTPVLISGCFYDSKHEGMSAHAWLIDGLFVQRARYTMMRYCEYTDNWTSFDETYDSFASAKAKYDFTGEYDIQTFVGTDDVEVLSFLMNWGENGGGDDVYYGVYDDWSYKSTYIYAGYDDNETYKRRIYYDFK